MTGLAVLCALIVIAALVWDNRHHITRDRWND